MDEVVDRLEGVLADRGERSAQAPGQPILGGAMAAGRVPCRLARPARCHLTAYAGSSRCPGCSALAAWGHASTPDR